VRISTPGNRKHAGHSLKPAQNPEW
jgi:hypothetical protein